MKLEINKVYDAGPTGCGELIMGGSSMMVIIFFYTRLQKQFPGQSFFEFIEQGTLGRIFVYILTSFFIIYFILMVAYILRIATIVVKMFLLGQTPAEVIAVIFVLTLAYATSKGIQGIIHLNLLFVPIMLFTLFLILIFSVPELDINHIRPVLAEGIMPILPGVKESIFSVLGIEILFFFMKSMKQTDIRALPLNMSISVVILAYVSVTIFSYCIFTFEMTKFITFPTIEIAKDIMVPGGFLERIESLMLTIWMLTIFNTLSIYHFLAVDSIKKYALKRLSRSTITAILSFTLLTIAFIPNSLNELFDWTPFVSYMGMALIIICLLYGYFVYWLKSKKENQPKIENM